MLREYIESLYNANKSELEELEKRMRTLMQDLSCAEEWMHNLLQNQNLDRNIFSPRSQWSEGQEKLSAAKSNLEEIRQKVEYTREKIEDSLKKREELKKMLEEAARSDEDISLRGGEEQEKKGEEEKEEKERG